MTVSEFIENTYIDDSDFHSRPRIFFKDGFSLSVQGGPYCHCKPNDNVKTYTEVEVGYPSMGEELLYPYSQDSWDEKVDANGLYSEHHYTNTYYSYVPMSVVEEVANKHGGVDIEEIERQDVYSKLRQYENT